MSVTTTRPVDLELLRTQLASAGIATTALGQSGNVVHTYNDRGEAMDLPPSAQSVVDAHDYTQAPQYQQAQADGAALNGFPTRAQIQQKLGQIDADLVTLGGVITLAQAGPILRRTVQNQKSIIQALAVWVYRNQ